MVERLSEFPWVVVRVVCNLCNRSGSYKLARLAARYGPDIALDDLLDRLAGDCPWRPRKGERKPAKYSARHCHACFKDLMFQPDARPDLPP